MSKRDITVVFELANGLGFTQDYADEERAETAIRNYLGLIVGQGYAHQSKVTKATVLRTVDGKHLWEETLK